MANVKNAAGMSCWWNEVWLKPAAGPGGDHERSSLCQGQKVDKAGTQVEENAPIEVRGQALAYVSRGGLKLEKALKTFPAFA